MRSSLVVWAVLAGCDDKSGGTTEETGTPGASEICSAEVSEDGLDGAPALYAYEVYDTDAPDRILRREEDFGADGTIDTIITWARDEAGNELRMEIRDADGVLLNFYAFTWTADALPATYTRPADSDLALGTVTTSWTYDADGNVVAVDEDLDEDGVSDFRVTSTLRPDGQPERDEYDEGADGTIEAVGVYDYDAIGRRTRYAADSTIETTVYTDPVLEVGSTTHASGGSDLWIDGFGRDAEGREVYAAEDRDLATPGWDRERWIEWDGDLLVFERSESEGWSSETFWTYDALGREVETVTEHIEPEQRTTRTTRTFGGSCP